MTTVITTESALVAAVLTRGPAALLELRRTPFEPKWITSPTLRLAFEAAESVAIRGEQPCTAEIVAEVTRHAGSERAAEVRGELQRIVATQNGAPPLPIGTLATALADALPTDEARPVPTLRGVLTDALHRFTVTDLTSPPPRQEFILHPHIPAGVVTTLAGPGGSSKTTMLVYLAVCRALGIPFFGTALPRRGRTAILTTEDGVADYHRKLAALRHDLGDTFDAAAVADQVAIFDLAGIPVRMVEADRGSFRPTALADDLAAVLAEQVPGTDLVIMETVSRLTGGMETNESLSILVEAGQRVCRLLSGAAVLLVAHTSQEAGRAGFTDQYTPRGGSALGDSGRSTLVLTRLNEKTLTTFAPDADLPACDLERYLVLNHPKSNGAEPAKPLILERTSTPYGPILRPAALRSRVVDVNEQINRLCTVIADLTTQGTPATEKRLRSYTTEIGCPEKKLPRLLDEAVATGRIRQAGKRGQGGGYPYEVVP